MAYETTTELRNLLQEEVNDTAPSTATQTRYVNLLDRAHKNIVSGGSELNVDDRDNPIRRPFIFPWAVSSDPIIVNTEAAYTTGTVNVTNGSASVTFSASIVSSRTGWLLNVGEDDEFYKITHTAGTDTASLDAAYIGTTDTAASFKLVKVEYTFGSDIMVPVDHIRAYDGGRNYRISLVDRQELLDRFPVVNLSEGHPKMAAVVKQSEGSFTIRFSHYTTAAERFELWYVPVPSTLDTSSVNPIIPKHHRPVLVHLAAYYHLQKRDDDRARAHLQLAKDLYQAMLTETRQIMGGNDEFFGCISPWPGGMPKSPFGSVGSVDIDLDL